MFAGARREVARWLEEGTLDAAWSRAVASAASGTFARALARPLHVPEGVISITVGGATLGGSGKTRVALACARALARAGVDVVLVGHGYRARSSRARGARVVSPVDRVEDVGDEALACARALAGDERTARARVVVGRPRQDAIDFAARLGPRPPCVVIDGPLQLAPRRSSLAILAVDRDEPWGSGAVVPAGDLRARPEALLAHADRVVPVDAALTTVVLDGQPRPVRSFASWVADRGLSVGLFSAVARPERLTRALAEAGIAVKAAVRAPDHGPLSDRLGAALASAPVDLWVATEKCVSHFTTSKHTNRLSIVVLRDDLSLDPDLVSAMLALTPPLPGA